MTEWQPGGVEEGHREQEGVLGARGDGSVSDPVPKRSGPGVLMKKRFIRLVHMLRWVPTAPLGRPVVPDV
jgi:hypothetical protein